MPPFRRRYRCRYWFRRYTRVRPGRSRGGRVCAAHASTQVDSTGVSCRSSRLGRGQSPPWPRSTGDQRIPAAPSRRPQRRLSEVCSRAITNPSSGTGHLPSRLRRPALPPPAQSPHRDPVNARRQFSDCWRCPATAPWCAHRAYRDDPVHLPDLVQFVPIQRLRDAPGNGQLENRRHNGSLTECDFATVDLWRRLRRGHLLNQLIFDVVEVVTIDTACRFLRSRWTGPSGLHGHHHMPEIIRRSVHLPPSDYAIGLNRAADTAWRRSLQHHARAHHQCPSVLSLHTSWPGTILRPIT